MIFKFSLVALGLIASSSIFAAATISAPEEIVLLAVNDQEIEGGLLRGYKNEYKVDAGNTTISVRYQQYFEHLNGEHDILKSGVVTIPATQLQDGQHYQLSLVNPPKNFDAAKAYATQPTIALFDQNNQLLVQQTGANNEAKPWLSKGLFGHIVDLTEKKNTKQPAAVYAQNSAITTPVTTNSANHSQTVNAVNQPLIQAWQQASKVERQRFMSWLAEQSQ